MPRSVVPVLLAFSTLVGVAACAPTGTSPAGPGECVVIAAGDRTRLSRAAE